MSNHPHRRQGTGPAPHEPPPGRWERARLFVVWFFAPRPFPSAWRRRPYLRDRGRRPGKFSRGGGR